MASRKPGRKPNSAGPPAVTNATQKELAKQRRLGRTPLDSANRVGKTLGTIVRWTYRDVEPSAATLTALRAVTAEREAALLKMISADPEGAHRHE